jgi:hypothetical protein
LFRDDLGRSAIARRTAGRELHRVAAGVYAAGHVARAREANWMAAVLGGGEGAALSRFAAGKLLDVSRFPIPVIDVDLADVLTPHQLANVMHEAAFRGRLVPSAIRDAMGRVWGRPRLWVVDRALELYAAGSAGTRSGAEDAFLRLVSGFAEPLVNVSFEGFERDFRWPNRALVVEIDGPAHGRPHALLDDAGRDRTLREAGYTVLRFTHEDVHRRPRELASAVAGVVGG